MAVHVLVTGADKGLGLALARKFLDEGFTVYAGQYDTRSEAGKLAERYGDAAKAVPLDVTNAGMVAAAARLVSEDAGKLDILINNAALDLDLGVKLDQVDFDVIQQMIEVNTYGPLRMAQHFVPLLERGDRKTIVNISSEAGSIGDCWRDSKFGYCMSKAALNMQSRILEIDLKPKGFRILAVHPGWMRTDMGGPEADLAPEESAGHIFRLVDNRDDTDMPMFVRYDGQRMNF